MPAPIYGHLVCITLVLAGCASQDAHNNHGGANRPDERVKWTQPGEGPAAVSQPIVLAKAPDFGGEQSTGATTPSAPKNVSPNAPDQPPLPTPVPSVASPEKGVAPAVPSPAPQPVAPTPVATQPESGPVAVINNANPPNTVSVLLVGGLAVGIFALIGIPAAIYRASETFKARSRLAGYCLRIDGLMGAQSGLLKSQEENLISIAGDYLRDEKNLALQAISLDQLRRFAPGARFQPLDSVGVRNLLDLQSWTSASLQRLRGIGPDSAYKIMSAKTAITAELDRRPVRRPGIAGERANGLKLYAGLYVLFRQREKLHGQKEALGDKLTLLRASASFVNSRTGFVPWLLNSQNTGKVRDAIDEVLKVDAMISQKGPVLEVINTAEARLDEARAIARVAVGPAALAADVATNGELYQRELDGLLGIRGAGSSSPAKESRVPPKIYIPPEEPVSLQTRGDRSQTFGINRGGPIWYETAQSSGLSDRGPGAPEIRPKQCWVPAGRVVQVSGFSLSGGLIYLGRGLLAINRNSVEPALIDPALPVSRHGANCHERMLDYWPSYRTARPEARASYLQWHETGRSDPEADIGYVFLFFYGLERRALADPEADPSASLEIPTILEEVRRLRSIYSKHSSFERYSSTFLDYVEFITASRNLDVDLGSPPKNEQRFLSFALKKGLGFFARSGTPLPASWAFAWFYHDPRTRLPTPIERCHRQFETLFIHEYQRRFAQGIIVPSNKTRMSFNYRPASASFGRLLNETLDLPDVTVLSATYLKLNTVAQFCFEKLDAFGRFIGRNGVAESSVEAIVLQPPALWPNSVRQKFYLLTSDIHSSGAPHVIKLAELLGCFGDAAAISRSSFASLANGLGEIGFEMEPDVRISGSVPGVQDLVALYRVDAPGEAGAGYGLALLMLQLSSVVASADGTFSDSEVVVVARHIDDNKALSLWEKQRLRARLAIYRRVPPSLAGLKKVIEGLDSSARKGVVDMLFATIYANGSADPSEVKALEKIYSLFGIGSAELYTRLHALASYPEALRTTEGTTTTSAKLDMAKVEKLKIDSAEVTNRLKVIFSSSDDDAQERANRGPSKTPDVASASTLLGLDIDHSDLLTVLLSRPHWTRAEFLDLCSDKSLMPDGAIERINEAAFEKFDQPILDGDDPIEVASQLLEGKPTK